MLDIMFDDFNNHHLPCRLASALAVGALTVGLIGCGGDDDSADDPSVIEIVATDFAFEGIPDTIAAGTTFTLVNTAPAELHEIVAYRLPDDETRPMSELIELPPEQLMPLLAGPPAMVLLTPPGGDQIAAVGDGTLSEPGRYALFCGIPTGVSPDAYLAAAAQSEGGPPDIEGGPPHFIHGMWAEVTVE